MECNKLIKYGFILRYTITIITYYILYYYIDHNNIYLILPICLTFLDGVDNFLTRLDYYKDFNFNKD